MPQREASRARPRTRPGRGAQAVEAVIERGTDGAANRGDVEVGAGRTNAVATVERARSVGRHGGTFGSSPAARARTESPLPGREAACSHRRSIAETSADGGRSAPRISTMRVERRSRTNESLTAVSRVPRCRSHRCPVATEPFFESVAPRHSARSTLGLPPETWYPHLGIWIILL